jgi:hypothetical protein
MRAIVFIDLLSTIIAPVTVAYVSLAPRYINVSEVANDANHGSSVTFFT